jgi:hypothetical protein
MGLRRNFIRLPFRVRILLGVDGRDYTGEMLDISLQGLLLECPLPIPVRQGDHCRLQIALAAGVSLDFLAVAVHRRDLRIGCKFIGMDTATFTHLLRLMELNSGRPDKIAGELRLLAMRPLHPPAAVRERHWDPDAQGG